MQVISKSIMNDICQCQFSFGNKNTSMSNWIPLAPCFILQDKLNEDSEMRDLMCLSLDC